MSGSLGCPLAHGGSPGLQVQIHLGKGSQVFRGLSRQPGGGSQRIGMIFSQAQIVMLRKVPSGHGTRVLQGGGSMIGLMAPIDEPT